MELDLEERLLNALELFHYASRFRGQVFSILIEEQHLFGHILNDIRALVSAGIKVAVFAGEAAFSSSYLNELSHSGHVFELVHGTREDIEDGHLKKMVEAFLAKEVIPVVCLREAENAPALDRLSLLQLVLEATEDLKALKLVIPIRGEGLVVDGKIVNNMSSPELEEVLGRGCTMEPDSSFMVVLFHWLSRVESDVVLLQAAPGVLFQEVFTHDGAGSLLSDNFPNVFRQARKTDVRDISLILKPYMKSGVILPITDDALLTQIEDWYVYTVDGQITATARLTRYGNSVELGKVSTLPRFQGKGRASNLIENLVKVARDNGRDSVFALTVREKMAELFLRLGFKEVDRELLPEEWKKSYDFSRPSRAFMVSFKEPC